VKKIIVTTTINAPTEALRRFAEMDDWELLVVGDLKTPHEDFSSLNCKYLGPEEQSKKYPLLSELIGWNSIQRRNLGFLEALRFGAEVIASVDDDNIPLDQWGSNLIVGSQMELDSYSGNVVFDPLAVTNYPHLWHRGFPIQRLRDRVYQISTSSIFVGVQAGFWNGDPDVDAICRMEHGPNCSFDDAPFPFTTSAFSPFNSQNTFITKEVAKNYFMFPGIGRMDDIWAAYYVEALGHKVAYTSASVVQERNVHDLTRDFEGEVIGYTKTEQLLHSLSCDPQAIFSFLPEKSGLAFKEYLRLADSLA
jgi:hypothetical protein